MKYKELEISMGSPLSILTFDPGESTGWCYLSRDNELSCGTISKNHSKVAAKIEELIPDIVIYESFNLYPSMAKSLAWSSFYPCEVIGVIKYVATLNKCEIISQQPSVKKFAGPLPKGYNPPVKTEHSKDATQHLCYYLRQIGEISRVQ